MIVRTLVALSMLLSAGVTLGMDLMDLYREAKANDARYAAARSQFRAMQERVPQARAGVAPEVDVDGGQRRYEYRNKRLFSRPFPASGRR